MLLQQLLREFTGSLSTTANFIVGLLMGYGISVPVTTRAFIL